jgi:hypothetical protein
MWKRKPQYFATCIRRELQFAANRNEVLHRRGGAIMPTFRYLLRVLVCVCCYWAPAIAQDLSIDSLTYLPATQQMRLMVTNNGKHVVTAFTYQVMTAGTGALPQTHTTDLLNLVVNARMDSWWNRLTNSWQGAIRPGESFHEDIALSPMPPGAPAPVIHVKLLWTVYADGRASSERDPEFQHFVAFRRSDVQTEEAILQIMDRAWPEDDAQHHLQQILERVQQLKAAMHHDSSQPWNSLTLQGAIASLQNVAVQPDPTRALERYREQLRERVELQRRLIG